MKEAEEETMTDEPSVESLEEAEERRRVDRRRMGTATASAELSSLKLKLNLSSQDGGGLRLPTGAWSAGGAALPGKRSAR